jgi:hypothetical protein
MASTQKEKTSLFYALVGVVGFAVSLLGLSVVVIVLNVLGLLPK